MSKINIDSVMPRDDGTASTVNQITEEVINKTTELKAIDKLTLEDTERLLSIITVPGIAVPLLLEFFGSRARLLVSKELRNLMSSTMFEFGELSSPAQEAKQADQIAMRSR